MQASSIMQRAVTLLSDEDHTRWPLTEMADWLNEGVHAIILAKPSASSKTVTIQLAAGTQQSVPDTIGDLTVLRIVDVVRNAVAVNDDYERGKAITPVGRNILDAQEPNWHDERFLRRRQTVEHVVFDEDNPREFWVYPGNNGQGAVDVVVSFQPAPIATTGTDLATYQAETIGLKPAYDVPLLEYLLHRCFLKDDLQGQAHRADLHYARFAQMVGIKIDVERSTSPNRRRAEAS